jgi:ribonuclease VapC
MVIDTSAFVAIMLKEPDADSFLETIDAAATRLMSAANVVEAGIVLTSRAGPDARGDLLDLIRAIGIEVVPVDLEQANLALEAYRRFGRGNHPAGLNFGDCFAYALAEAHGEPLLFKGDDFSRTPIAAVLPR